MSLTGESVTGVILAGGRSRRFGTNKALSVFRGERLIERLVRSLQSVTGELLIVTNSFDEYAFLDLPMVSDLITDCGPLAGIYTALKTVSTPLSLCVACDMPFAKATFMRHLVSVAGAADVVTPVSEMGDEPLCAVYRDTCVPLIETRLQAGQYKITGFFEHARVKRVRCQDTPVYDPWSLFNVNTRDDYAEALKHLEES